MLKVDKSKLKKELQRLSDEGLSPPELALKFDVPPYVIYNFLRLGAIGVSFAIKMAEAINKDTKFFLKEEVE